MPDDVVKPPEPAPEEKKPETAEPEKKEVVEEVVEPQTPPADPATKGLDDVLEWKGRRDKDIDDLMSWRTAMTAEREAEKEAHRKTIETKEKKDGVQKQEKAGGGTAGKSRRLKLFRRKSGQ